MLTLTLKLLSLEFDAAPLDVLPEVVFLLEVTLPELAVCVLLLNTPTKLVLSTVLLLVVDEVTVLVELAPVVSMLPVLLLLPPAPPPEAAVELLAIDTLACSELELVAAPLVVIPFVVVFLLELTLPLEASCGLLLTRPTPFIFLTCEVFDVVEDTLFVEL